MTRCELEVWKPIPGHPKYEASTLGRVRNATTGHVLKPQPNTRGYLKVHLGRSVQMKVHRAVALAHIPLPDGGDLFTAWEVDHLDFNRTNNRRSNLRWLPHENNRHRYLRHALEHEAATEMETPPMTAQELAEYESWHATAGW